MSDFSGLKKQRKAKDTKSFVASDHVFGIETPTVPDGPEETNEMNIDSESSRVEGSQSTTIGNGTAPLRDEGLYRQIPPSLDVRISTGDTGKGRGIYSKYYRKPGECFLQSVQVIIVTEIRSKCRRRLDICQTPCLCIVN